MAQLKVVVLREEELEALFLADGRDMDHETAAAGMSISRSTFSRILAQARKSVATALTEGAALKIDGGDFTRVNDADSSSPLP